ncbi:MAG: hypothetical protein ACF8XB_06555, partial [Planctomycetota bacterium JB042]
CSSDLAVVESLPATTHASGEAVIDYRVLVATVYPYEAAPPGWTAFPTVRALKDVARFGEVSFSADEIDGVEGELTVHGEVPSATGFVGAARVVTPIDADVKVPQLVVAGARNLGPGTVVRLSAEDRREYNLVVSVGEAADDTFLVTLQEPCEFSYAADEAILEGLARAPVNVNTCSRRVLEALLTGIRLKDSSDGVDPKEAAAVADALIAARPLEGERELSGVLAGVARAGTITEENRRALLLNAQNAMDARLLSGTAPFAYRSAGVFRLDAAASENLPAGREAARRFARQIGRSVPPGPNVALFDSQVEFERQRRLTRTGKHWTTGPVHLDGGDAANEPSLRTEAYATAGRYPAAGDAEPPAWAGLAPVRQEGRRDDTAWMPDPEAPIERILHFDGAPEDPQALRSDDHSGWNYGADGPLALDVESDLVALLDERGYVRPFEVELWWHPSEETGEGITYLFDSGDTEDDKYSDITNRVLLFVDGTELILRVCDASVPDPIGERFPGFDAREAGDWPQQFAEIRYAFDDGLPFEADVPYHVRAYVSGNKPSDLALFVDNVPRGRRAFQTRLAEDIGPPANAGAFASIPGYTAGSSEKIKVEDATLFPPFGVVRIDQELIEYTDRTDDELIVSRVTGDAFGGRARRGSRGDRHLESEAVELFGYPGIVVSRRVPTGNVGLLNAMSAYGVAMVDPEAQEASNPIETTFEGGGETLDVEIGKGVDESVVTLPLVTVANPNSPLGASASAGGGDLSSMFDRNGGFALIVSSPFPPPSTGGARTLSIGALEAELTTARVGRTPNGSLIGLGELIYYQGFDGTTLNGIRRAPTSGSSTQWVPENHSNLVNHGNQNTQSDLDATAVASHVHIADWQQQFVGNGHGGKQPIFVIPISVRPGVTAVQLEERYPVPELRGTRTLPEMVQIGTGFLGTVAGGGTEWVRYDVMGEGCLVRDEPTRIRRAIDMMALDVTVKYTLDNINQFPSGEDLAAAVNFESIAGTQEQQGQIETDAGLAPSRLDGGMLAFRGVLGTETKAHPAGAIVLPVVRTLRDTVRGGRPGARDYVTLIDPQSRSREEQRINYAYCETDVEVWGGYACHFAFDTGVEGAYEANFEDLLSAVDPSSGGAAMAALANQNVQSRDLTRILKFPSGELPTRVGEQIFLGGDLRGERSPVGGSLDEVEWFNPQTPSEVLPRHARFVLSRDDEFDETLFLSRRTLRYNAWLSGDAVIEAIDPPSNLPEDGFLILIDDELIGISDMILEDQDSEAELRVAVGGRGMLGTPLQFHPRLSSVREMTFLRVSLLERSVSERASRLELADASDFPARGYVLVGQEIVGYSRKEGNTLVMPDWIDPDDRQRTGLFRGRFGTTPLRHDDGVLVFHFPTRTEDRWHPRADAPELAYFGLLHQATGAFYRSLLWHADGGSPLCDLVVQARVGGRGAFTDDVAGAADLFQFELPGGDQRPNLIGRQGDSLELRVFTRYKPGAFDPTPLDPTRRGGDRGGANDWKRAPRMSLLGVDWIGGPARLEYEEWQ